MPVQATLTRPTFTDNDSISATIFNGATVVSVLVPDATTSTEGVVRLAGDLTGNAASPQLIASGATPGTYGASGDDFPQITVDAKGRITSVANRALPNTAVTPGTYGNSGDDFPQITVDAKGRITSVANRALPNTAVTPGTYGNSDLNVPNLTVDAKGRATAAANRDITQAVQNALGNSATRNVGTTANTVCAGDDSRIPSFTPVQQGGGAGQGTNKVYIGWSGSDLKVQVDSTDFGGVLFKNQAPFSRMAESGEYGIPAGYSNISWPHGLGARPRLFTGVFRCVIAERGYSVGDEIPIENTASSWGVIWANSTFVNYRSNDGTPAILRNDSTGAVNMTPANWRIVLRAFV